MILGKKVAVVMPAYNAGKTLRRTWEELPHEYVDEVILTGGYFDLPDSSSVKGVLLSVKNPGGDNINNSPITIPFSPDRRFSVLIRLVEGTNDISAIVTDLSGNVGRQDLHLTYIKAKSTTIVDGTGGTVTSPDGAHSPWNH